MVRLYTHDRQVRTFDVDYVSPDLGFVSLSTPFGTETRDSPLRICGRCVVLSGSHDVYETFDEV